jgi:acyl transferase domain-containing protein
MLTNIQAHMKEAGQTFARMLGSKVSSRAPAIPMFSSQTNNVIRKKHALNGPYWQSSYDNPVLFNTVMQKLILSRSVNAAPLMLVEIGPHSALAGPIRQIIKECQRDVSYIPTLVRSEDATHNLLTAAGKLFLKGIKLDFQAVNRGGRVLADLPSYSWNHSTRYWDEGRLSKQWRLREFAHHDLLGSRVADSGDLQPVWRNLLRLVDIPWCRDHVIAGDIVFPGAGYVAMAVEAIRQINGGADDVGFTLRSVSLLAALAMNETAATEIVLTMRPLRLTDSLDDSSWYEFSIMSYNTSASSWTKHCTGQARQGRDHEVESMHITDLPRKIQSSSWYKVLKKAGMNYGPAFQGLERLSAHPITNSAVAHVSNAYGPADSAYQLHPSTLDACIQLFTTAACRGQARSFSTVPYVPTWIGEVYVKRPQDEVAVQADATFGQKGAIGGTCVGFAGNDPAVILKDVKMSPLGDAGSSRGDDPHAGVTLSWMPDLSLTTVDRLGDYELSQDYQQWLRLLAHKKPDMNILSFGSAVGETTPAHLSALTSEYGERMFSSLTIFEDSYTDQTNGSYHDAPGVTVKAFDTDQEATEWQVEHASADLIFLSEVSRPRYVCLPFANRCEYSEL